ncbi:MAG: YihY/virulence factor BrkB family protein [Pseudomonadota bacterium]
MTARYLDEPHDAASEAVRPAALPKRAWLSAAMRAAETLGKENLSLVAAGCAFYALLALAPGLAALAGIYGFFADPSHISRHLDLLEDVAPPDAYRLIADQAAALAEAQRGTLGWTSLGALALALWSARAGVRALMIGVGIAYRERDKRPFFKALAATLALTLSLATLVALALGLVVVVPGVLALVPLAPSTELLGSLLRWPIAVAALIVGLALLYRYGPARRSARIAWLTPGSLTALAIWLVVSIAFSAYLSRFGNYNETYGALGAVAALLMWFWLSALAALFGATLNAELELATAADTTVGEDRPMGVRGAFVADHVTGP